MQGYNCMGAVHRISPILARQGPNHLHIILYHDLVEFVRAWCVLWRLQWGARRQRKSAGVLNDPREIEGADFDQIPVSIIFDVIVHTAFFVLWAMRTQCNTGEHSSFPIKEKLGVCVCVFPIPMYCLRPSFFSLPPIK